MGFPSRLEEGRCCLGLRLAGVCLAWVEGLGFTGLWPLTLIGVQELGMIFTDSKVFLLQTLTKKFLKELNVFCPNIASRRTIGG